MNDLNLKTILSLTLCVLLSSACTDNSSQKADHENHANTTSLSDEAHEEIREFKNTMRQKLNAVEIKIDRLEADTSKKSKAEYNETMVQLKKLKADISEKLSELKEDSKDSYMEAKLKIEQQYEKLATEVEKAVN